MEITKVNELTGTVTLKCDDGVAQTVSGLINGTADGIKEAVASYCQAYDAGKALVAQKVYIAPEELPKVRAIEGKAVLVAKEVVSK